MYRQASPDLRAAAIVASVIDVVLALNIVGYWFLGDIGSPVQFGLAAAEIFLFIPLLAPLVLAAAIAPPILVAWRLRSRGGAWLAIALIPVGCLITAAQLGAHVLAVNGSRDRDQAAVRAFAGAHGEGRGFRFEVRPAAGDRMLELHVTSLSGEPLREPASAWHSVFCEIRRGQVEFAEGLGAVRESESGAVFAFSDFSSHGDPKPDAQFTGSYCSFKESSGAWHAAVMHA